jgi:hypothetical protein
LICRNDVQGVGRWGDTGKMTYGKRSPKNGKNIYESSVGIFIKKYDN